MSLFDFFRSWFSGSSVSPVQVAPAPTPEPTTRPSMPEAAGEPIPVYVVGDRPPIVSVDQLARIFPKLEDPAGWAKALNPHLADYLIDTPIRVTKFLAQVGHESAEFSRLVENLNYSAQGLANTWPSRYSTTGRSGGPPNQMALTLARNPELIANNCYANRMGNGDEKSGDGWRFRGRGLIQITGRTNYLGVAAAIHRNLDDLPFYLGTKDGAAESAAWWWHAHGCNEIADKADFTALTQKINGGQTGAAAREALYTRVRSVMMGAA